LRSARWTATANQSKRLRLTAKN